MVWGRMFGTFILWTCLPIQWNFGQPAKFDFVSQYNETLMQLGGFTLKHFAGLREVLKAETKG